MKSKKENKKSGKLQSFYRNGELKSTGSYKKGKKEGIEVKEFKKK